MDPEVAEKIKYAKFKAADIIRALKEGRAPVPGPPGGVPSAEGQEGEGPPPGYEQPFSPPSVEHLSLHPSSISPHIPQPKGGASPSAPSPSSHPSTAKTAAPSPVVVQQQKQSGITGAYSGTSSPSEVVGESRYDYKILSQAQRHAKFAISSLQYDDINTALENLQKAMDLLKPYVE